MRMTDAQALPATACAGALRTPRAHTLRVYPLRISSAHEPCAWTMRSRS